MKTYGSKTIGFYVHIGNENGKIKMQNKTQKMKNKLKNSFLIFTNRVLALCMTKQDVYVLRDFEPNTFFDFGYQCASTLCGKANVLREFEPNALHKQVTRKMRTNQIRRN